MTTPRAVLTVLMLIGSLALPFSAETQPAGKIPRIGYLSQRPGPSPQDEAFRQGLRDLDYTEDTNITVEYRWAAFSQDRLLALARELVRLRVDLIVAAGGAAALAAKKATSTTPIVFAGGDPVGMRLVSSLARPGGNATGVSLLTYGLGPKRLALLKEALPGIRRVAVLSNPRDPFHEQQSRDTQDAATSLGLRLAVLEVGEPRELDQAFSALGRDRPEALLVSADPMFFNQRATIVRLASQNGSRGFTSSGISSSSAA